MADVKWIKITTDLFDNRKIKHLRNLPDGNNIVLLWIMLLTMAGRCNADGMVFLTKNIPYTSKMLADELGMQENTVQLALTTFEQFGMIVFVDGFLRIAGWEEYQNIEGMERIREQTRKRVARHRKNQKEISSNVTVTLRNAIEEDIEEDKEKEEEIEGERDIEKRGDRLPTPSCNSIVQLFNDICISFPSVKVLSDSRKKAIKARLRTYSYDDFKRMFENAEASSFLKGKNDRNWSATFDWLIKDTNMAKVLEGNYKDKQPPYKNTRNKSSKKADELDEAYKMMANWSEEKDD